MAGVFSDFLACNFASPTAHNIAIILKVRGGNVRWPPEQR